jgi:hypothetical protein
MDGTWTLSGGPPPEEGVPTSEPPIFRHLTIVIDSKNGQLKEISARTEEAMEPDQTPSGHGPIGTEASIMMNNPGFYRQLLSNGLIGLSILSPVLVAFFTVRRTPTHRSLRLEVALCILLSFFVILVWAGFVAFLMDISDEIAGLSFIRNHLALGEDPEWVLKIAGDGIPQPFEIILTWRWFQWGTIAAGIIITILAWLGARFWTIEPRKS